MCLIGFPNLSELSTALTRSGNELSEEAIGTSRYPANSSELGACSRSEAKRANLDPISPTWPKRRRDTPRSPSNNGASPRRRGLPVTFASELLPSDLNKRHSAELQFLQPSSLGIREPATYSEVEFINNVSLDLDNPDVLEFIPIDAVDSPSRSDAPAQSSGAVPRRRRQYENLELPSHCSASISCDLSDGHLQTYESPRAQENFSSSQGALGLRLSSDLDETEGLATPCAAALEYLENTIEVPTSYISSSLPESLSTQNRRHLSWQRTLCNTASASGNDELTYREYRRQKIMEEQAGQTLDDPPTSIKRQLSIESERELLGHMNKVKSFFTIRKGNDSPEVRSVDQVMQFLKIDRDRTKKSCRGLQHEQN
ncbi:hypothetical protein FHG87_010337 [Trinorchestia longiramus]|nr:hypothetical protein FHG87_010337 [Trinorchestia longiramus]